MRFVIGIVIILMSSAFAPKQDPRTSSECAIPLFYRMGLIARDFDRFENGAGNWHDYAAKGCQQEAHELVLDYLEAHADDLNQSQKDQLQAGLDSLENEIIGARQAAQ